MLNDPRYDSVAEALPATLPPITRGEAEKAAKRIFRHFGSKAQGSPNMTSRAHFYRVRTCWLSSQSTSGHFKGWGRLVHDVSHQIFRARHPSFRPHAAGHATLEAEIAAYVVEQGWLCGSLKPKLLSRTDLATIELAKVEGAIRRWTTKYRRAQTALRKLESQRTRLRRQGADTTIR